MGSWISSLWSNSPPDYPRPFQSLFHAYKLFLFQLSITRFGSCMTTAVATPSGRSPRRTPCPVSPRATSSSSPSPRGITRHFQADGTSIFTTRTSGGLVREVYLSTVSQGTQRYEKIRSCKFFYMFGVFVIACFDFCLSNSFSNGYNFNYLGP